MKSARFQDYELLGPGLSPSIGLSFERPITDINACQVLQQQRIKTAGGKKSVAVQFCYTVQIRESAFTCRVGNKKKRKIANYDAKNRNFAQKI